jgi:outer membrane protein assembly factor BamB
LQFSLGNVHVAMSIKRFKWICFATIAVAFFACGDNTPPAVVEWQRAFRTADLEGCALASPVLADSSAGPVVIVATSEGVIAAYQQDGMIRWQLKLPANTGHRAWLAATPALVDKFLVVAWQDAIGESRISHHVAVVNVDTGILEGAFPTLTLSATAQGIPFLPSNAFSRAAIVAARRGGEELGVAYVSFGNIRDIQPWHGWVFEIDLKAWRDVGATAAVSSVLLTTSQSDCGPPGGDGAVDMRCGGGVWAPSGPTLVPDGDDYQLWVATGNGYLDLDTNNFANSVLRTGRGLHFAPSCSNQCDNFNPIDPNRACMDSCTDLFMPRLRPSDPPLSPPNQRCVGKTFLECYAALDLDLGR